MILGYTVAEWELYIEWLERYVYSFEQTCDVNVELRADGFETSYGTCAWCNWGSNGKVRSYSMFSSIAEELLHAKLLSNYYSPGRTKTRVDYTVGLIADIREMLQAQR